MRAHETAGLAAAIRSLSSNTAVCTSIALYSIVLLINDACSQQVQYILSDIPFFTIGILSIGVFSFFLILGKVTRYVI